MKLVFIHGWGLDTTLWDGVSALLPEYEQERIDLGFYSSQAIQQEDPSPAKTKDLLRKSEFSLPLPHGERNKILIGHSLGFVHGLSMNREWGGWIAINSFPRFVKTETQTGCSSATALRDIALRLKKDPNKTVRDFHAFIGAKSPQGMADYERLRAGLDELRDNDVSLIAKKISPGLILASRNDVLVPAATSENLAEGKTILWHEKGGHILPQNDPAFCADAIRNFMKEHNLVRT